jgi:hypothetical protein
MATPAIETWGKTGIKTTTISQVFLLKRNMPFSKQQVLLGIPVSYMSWAFSTSRLENIAYADFHVERIVKYLCSY